MSAPRPDPEPIVVFFASLGIPRLAELLDAGDLSPISPVSMASYCNVAALWSDPSADEDREELATHFGGLLVHIVATDSPDYFEVDGEPFLRTPDGDMALTEAAVTHFQRMFSLLGDEARARQFLALAISSN
jgi:hypothetical protein